MKKISPSPEKQGLYDPANEHDACGLGVLADIQGRKSNKLVPQALQILINLDHRGACGCEKNTGDGAGILFQKPHAFLQNILKSEKIVLPEEQAYAVGMLFLSPEKSVREKQEQVVAEIITEEGQICLGWRTVPVNNSQIGNSAKLTEPCMRQVFIAAGKNIKDPQSFERKLYVIRKIAEQSLRYSKKIPGYDYFYVSSLSSRTIVYKGMLLATQMPTYFPELNDPAIETSLALVHSRFSTNTFPNWTRAHPNRFVAHNGEINTLRGNVNWMHARQTHCESEIFGEDLKKLIPVINPDGSDSAMFDNVVEFLHMAGRSLPHCMMMMIPEPWSNHETMSASKKAFYEYHSCLMEPWDGPASMAFTDGIQIGAVLDRNGLRPSRYYVTKNDLVVLSSEVGVLDIADEDVKQKGRLQPGRMFLVDTEQKKIIADEEIKEQISAEHPYQVWLDENIIQLESLQEFKSTQRIKPETLTQLQLSFGYTYEDLHKLIGPMAQSGVETIGSMGNDTPLAVLSNHPQLLYSYFKQLFAQVTNPPIDCIREEIVTSAGTTIGSERNLLQPDPAYARQIKLESPIISNGEIEKLRQIERAGFQTVTLPILFDVNKGSQGLEMALEELFTSASKAIAKGANIIIISDRNVNEKQAAIPALLALSGLHHHLIREGTRTKVALVVESAEPREVHHFALLISYGASAINPYLALESIRGLIEDEHLQKIDRKKAVKNFIKAVSKGVVKTMSKMGISTIQSYHGAQIFEAVGISKKVIDKYFTWTSTRIEGLGLNEIAAEVVRRHLQAFPVYGSGEKNLSSGGMYQWKHDGEFHLFNPDTIHKLQIACRTGKFEIFKEYSAAVNNQLKNFCTLRSLFDIKFAENPIPLSEVESAESIMKRFKTGAMSYGSISKEAHEALAIAMNRIGGKSNTGEGGEDPERYIPLPNGDSKRSAIKQVASGRFGVTSEYLVNANEIQIKMAQGAKPGEGGQLPGTKVYPWIAKTRHSTPGVGLISPPPHHDIYSIEDLSQLIHDLKNANTQARISVKLVSEVGVGTVAAGVAKAHADVVLISGYDGGTGASPLSSVYHAGVPWELGLAEAQQTLLLNNLRSRIVVETDGQLKTGRDVVIAALLGAEEFGFATSPLVALGCIMMRVCHQNTCPVGVATQDPELRKKFKGDPKHVENFMRFIAEEAREYMARLGIRNFNELVGQTQRLDFKQAIEHWKAKGLDLSSILHQPEVPADTGKYCTLKQDHGIEDSLDVQKLLKIAEPALERGDKVSAQLPIKNINRVTGTILGSAITRKYGAQGLPADTIRLKFNGSAGQSFGAFIPPGLTMEISGDSNDYVGKGLSGGKIIVAPSKTATFKAQDNIIIGNVALYGATSGELYINGMAGERFAVRNSGALAVVEGVGDHACEYMTGGRVIVLGKCGRNFAAGMSGGIAYVLDTENNFAKSCNLQMVNLQKIAAADEVQFLKDAITLHQKYTGSELAGEILQKFEQYLSTFVKVIPKDYERMLQCLEKVKSTGLSGEAAVMAAFEENCRDLSRVGGN